MYKLTLEEAQQLILEQQDKLKLLENEKAELLKSVTEKTNKVTELQEHNQRLFLRITDTKTGEEKETEVISLEDFTKTIKL